MGQREPANAEAIVVGGDVSIDACGRAQDRCRQHGYEEQRTAEEEEVGVQPQAGTGTFSEGCEHAEDGRYPPKHR
jgi:hypothetical protein